MSINVEDIINRIQIMVDHYILKNRLSDALDVISLAADISYNYNQWFYDQKLEESIELISLKLFQKTQLLNYNNDTILFYDGFGLDTRGLAQIYILGLCKKYNVIYVCDEDRVNSIPKIIKIVMESGGKVTALKTKNSISKIFELKSIIDYHKPSALFMYTYPHDVVIPVTLHHYKGVIKSYQINLTDHAYWLGAKAFDYCIEFRDFGAYITRQFRKVSEEKIILLPFYPVIDYEQVFLGYPFSFNRDGYKLIFSGGSLYKTFDSNGLYYRIVRHILKKHEDVLFWYAGSGNTKEIDKLIKEYPNRVFFTNERKDLYQVLVHCDMYLSTYPICGGLMFLYAAQAGIPPLTLRFDCSTDGFLKDQDKLGIQFDDFEELCRHIDYLLYNEEALIKISAQIKNKVLQQGDFETELYSLVERNSTKFKLEYKKVDLNKFLSVYKSKMDLGFISEIIAGHRCRVVCELFPCLFFLGLLKKVKHKLLNK